MIRQRWLDTATAISIGVVLFGIYLASPIHQVGDSWYTLLSSENLLGNAHLRLDDYFGPDVDLSEYPGVVDGARLPRHIRQYGPHLYYLYPPGSPVLSAPLVAVLRFATGDSTLNSDGTYDPGVERRWQSWCAALIVAATCVLLFFVAREFLGTLPSAVIALAAGLGSQLWSTASLAVWSHTWIVFLLSAALLLVARAESRSRGLRPILLATILAWCFFTRPTAALFILPISVWVLRRRPRELVGLAATGAAWGLLLVVYSLAEYGSWLPPYYLRASQVRLLSVPVGLAGQMISPARGLLVFVPLSAFAVWLSLRNWGWVRARGLMVTGLAAVGMHTLAMAGYGNWWAGHCYGARFHTDLVPIFVLLGAMGFDAARRRYDDVAHPALGSTAKVIFAVCLVWGIVLNGAGAMSRGGAAWNKFPEPIARNPMRAFDWENAQFLWALFPDRFDWPDPREDGP